MHTLRDVCIRGLLLPRIAMMPGGTRVCQTLTYPAEILEVVAQVGVSLNQYLGLGGFVPQSAASPYVVWEPGSFLGWKVLSDLIQSRSSMIFKILHN